MIQFFIKSMSSAGGLYGGASHRATNLVGLQNCEDAVGVVNVNC